jgi:hypothetical protein
MASLAPEGTAGLATSRDQTYHPLRPKSVDCAAGRLPMREKFF